MYSLSVVLLIAGMTAMTSCKKNGKENSWQMESNLR